VKNSIFENVIDFFQRIRKNRGFVRIEASTRIGIGIRVPGLKKSFVFPSLASHRFIFVSYETRSLLLLFLLLSYYSLLRRIPIPIPILALALPSCSNMQAHCKLLYWAGLRNSRIGSYSYSYSGRTQ
jgi:hypothetical protein